MLMIRGIIIAHLLAFCFAANAPKRISFKTGNKLAVLTFESYGISDPITEYLKEELRQSIRALKIFNVQDKDFTNDINIFYPRKKNYWACWSKECAVDIGKQLEVNYVIAGNIQKKDPNEFQINGRLFSVDMETMINEFAMNSSSITDSLLLEMKKMAYNVSGLPIPDTLLVNSDSTGVNITESIERKNRINFPQFPKIPTKIKALMMSTAIPGSGQIWVEKKYPGYGFLGTEVTLGVVALISYFQYNKAWGGFEKSYSAYQNGMDPRELYELRPKIIQYAEDTRKYNSFMKNIRGVSASIWIVNMLHAYLVAPADDYFDGDSFFDIEYRPDINQFQFQYNF